MFVVGRAGSAGRREQLHAEHRRFGDLLTDASFDDTYRNLTRKISSAFFWAVAQPWRRLRYLAKVDADCFVKVAAMADLAKAVRSERRPHIVGRVWFNATVLRSGKWAVREKEFKASCYPPYASGSTYLLSLAAAERMFNAETFREVHDGRSFLWEDVHITGILRSRVNGIPVARTKFFRLNWESAKNNSLVPQFARSNFVSVHAMQSESDFLWLQREIDASGSEHLLKDGFVFKDNDLDDSESDAAFKAAVEGDARWNCR